MPPDNLQPDSPASDGMCWYRVLTNTRHITAEGTVQSQALKGHTISAAIGKLWSHEVSGRLVSLAGDVAAIEADAHQRVTNIRSSYAASHNGVIASNIVFVGVACAKSEEIRKVILDHFRMECVYTPQPPQDIAHSDIAIYAVETDANLEDVRDWLLRTLRAVRSNNLTTLVTACGTMTPQLDLPIPAGATV